MVDRTEWAWDDVSSFEQLLLTSGDFSMNHVSQHLQVDFDNAEFLYQLLDWLPVGVAVLDAAGDVLFWNRSAAVITGYHRDALKDVTLGDCFQGLDVGAADPIPGRPRREDWHRQDGRRITVILQWAHLRTKADHRSTIYAFIDMTENVIDEDSVQIVNQLLYEAAQRMQNQANTDGLTGLLNHRAFQERIRQEVSRTRRHKEPLSVAMFDVDHFKKCNDTYGHQFGDRVLAALSEVARNVFRQEDVVARYGGEEFVIMLPNTRVDAAVAVAERFRAAVEHHTVRYHGVEGNVTISCGVTSYEVDTRGEDVDLIVLRLVQQADEALYHAKASGRNRVVIHDYARRPKGS